MMYSSRLQVRVCQVYDIFSYFRKLAATIRPHYCEIMPINERILSHVDAWSSSGTGWFAARQPGIVRFFSDRLSGDALALGLACARQISLAFEHCERAGREVLASADLEEAEVAAYHEAHNRVLRGMYAERQAALIHWIAELMADPPVPLDRKERRDVGMALVAVTYAYEQAILGS